MASELTVAEENLQRVKTELKKWEIGFCKKHKRKPNKADIDEDLSIKDIYSNYSSLKKKISVLQKAQLDDVWGKSCKKSTELKNAEETESKNEEEGSTMAEFGKKIQAHAMSGVNKTQRSSIKKNFHSKKFSKENKQTTTNDNTTDDIDHVAPSGVFSKALKLTSAKASILNKSYSNYDDDIGSPEPRPPGLFMSGTPGISRKVPPGWLAWKDYSEPKEDTTTEGKGHNENVQSCENFDKSGNNSNTNLLYKQNEQTNLTEKGSACAEGKAKDVTLSTDFQSSSSTEFMDAKECVSNYKTSRGVIDKNNSVMNNASGLPQDPFLTSSVSDVKEGEFSKNMERHTNLANYDNRSKTKCSWSDINKPKPGTIKICDKSTKNVFDFDENKDDSVSNTQKGLKTKVRKKRKLEIDEEDIDEVKQTRKKSRSSVADGIEEMGQEVVWGEEISTNPVSDGESSNEETVQAPKKNILKSRPIKKAASSDNFVRLNMKLKTYKRKGRGMTGNQYKRKQWKQKMRDRSKSFGADKCFKCGQEGHWANRCPNKGQIEPSMTVDTEPFDEEDFPTLKEAAMMARGVKVQKDSTGKTSKSAAKKEGTDADATQNEVTNPEETESDEELEVESMVTRSAPEPVQLREPMEPYYEPNENGTPHELTKDVFTALKKFGFNSFRPGQEGAIKRILSGLSTLVVLSTGAGKSLCYQLPAYMYAQKSKCITLVVSPLVSLMEDQVTGLPQGIHGACIHTNMTKVQRERVIENVSEGKVHFLLISPEALVGGGGSASGCLPNISKLPPIAFACIDEAHCVSEWSHHFRPSYLRLCKVLKERFGVRCFLGLTATATLGTASSVAQHLGIRDYETATIRGAPVPSNLQLSVSRDEDREDALINLLQGSRFSKCDSIIIYCTRREQTDRLATLIRTCLKDKQPIKMAEEEEEDEKGKKKGKGKSKKAKRKSEWDAECYHAGLTPAQRRRVQNAFMSGRLRVVVATVAFGMGLDKADVRAVIHYTMPKSFESYVQEIGRAGRDGLPAHCHLFLDPEGRDMNELKRHIYGNTVDRHTIKKLLRRVFPSCKCRALHEQTQAEKFEDDGIDYCNSVVEDMVTEPPTDNTNGTHDPGPSPAVTPVKPPLTEPLLSPEAPKRLCPGHERAIPIERTVMDLDMKEEGIGTLLCYLELHSCKWVENLQPVYATCTLQCYGGPKQLQAVAKKCPPVAVALAKDRQRGKKPSNIVEFPVIEISDCMGWESGPVKRELKLLQWNFDATGTSGPRKSGVMVEFSELAFHLRSPGDLTDRESDEVLEFLDNRVQMQEKTQLYQLQNLYNALRSVSHKHYYLCSEEVDIKRSDKLKATLTEYFERQPTSQKGQFNKLSFSREMECEDSVLDEDQVTCEYEGQVRADVRSFIATYSQEHVLSGRAIARIFHGIESPCFPAKIWGRVRKYWRCNLDVDFNLLVKISTQELVRMR